MENDDIKLKADSLNNKIKNSASTFVLSEELMDAYRELEELQDMCLHKDAEGMSAFTAEPGNRLLICKYCGKVIPNE